MTIQNVSLFHNELISCGLSISGCSSDGTVHISERPSAPLIDGEPDPNWTDPTDNIVTLALAAHEQPLSSDECLALQAALTEQQWTAYIEARKALVRSMRAERYRQEADPLILSSIESALAASTPTDGKYEVTLPEESVTNWLTLKNSIRSELSYPE